MKAQQLLALCLLACIACTAFAKPSHKAPGYEEEYEKEGYKYEGDGYEKEGYKYDGDYEDKPECGPDQFPELKDALCVDTTKGTPVKLGYYGEDADCTIDKDSWCKPVKDTKWGCDYEYKKDTVCRPSAGLCDEEDKCSGDSAACPNKFKAKGTTCRAPAGICDAEDTCPGGSADCPDVKKDKTVVCLKSTNPCIKNAKCDGNSNSCPDPKNVAKGTPCKSDGVYGEAYGEDGKVAIMSDVTAEIAKKKGWHTCHRCHEGECTAFKYEWYKSKHSKKHDKHSDKYEKKSDKYDDEDEWYESKYDTEDYAKLEGYEPGVYCSKKGDY